MSTTINEGIDAEVREFLGAVRKQLTDLDADEQREILDGLEADLTDLVAEHGGGALGDPVAYARELRAAAGLEPQPGAARRARRPLGVALALALDAVSRRVDLTADRLPGDSRALLGWLRPLWWIARGWITVEVVDLLLGRGRYAGDLLVVPHMRGFGAVVLLAAILASVQLGRRKLWPAASRNAWARLLLVMLNCLAVVMAPLVLVQLGGSGDDHPYSRGFDLGYRQGQAEARASQGPKAGLYLNGTWVSNIYPYDAKGRPLVGVQLFNQVGKPINVITQPEHETCDATGPSCPEGVPVDNDGNELVRMYYPWTNGTTQQLNVFPIPSRMQKDVALSPTAFTEAGPPTVGAFPLASVPRVSLPGIKPGLLPGDR